MRRVPRGGDGPAGGNSTVSVSSLEQTAAEVCDTVAAGAELYGLCPTEPHVSACERPFSARPPRRAAPSRIQVSLGGRQANALTCRRSNQDARTSKGVLRKPPPFTFSIPGTYVLVVE
jgi:hypothetical protein